MTKLRDALKARLSNRQDETQESEGPSTAELASQIKALKAANTIDTGTARSERKPVAAEESVTARIRRRQEAQSTETPALEAAEPAPDATSFRERILRERQQNAEGEGQGPS